MSSLHELLTTAEAADLLNCSTRTVHRLVDTGQLEAQQKLPGLTGGYLFHPAEVTRARAVRAGMRAARRRAGAAAS